MRALKIDITNKLLSATPIFLLFALAVNRRYATFAAIKQDIMLFASYFYAFFYFYFSNEVKRDCVHVG